jgi:acyl-CoA synthetase (AMP-forming)/AMP-acid ligase II
MSQTVPVNVAEHLPVMAHRRPYQLAVVFPAGRDGQGRVAYTHWTFQQLDRETDALAHGLERIGIRQGTRTVLMVQPSLEFFALTFALFKVAAVPVLVDPGMGIANLGQCLAEAEPEAFIGIPKAQAARLLCRWARPTLKIIVSAGRRWFWRGYALSQVRTAGWQKGPYAIASSDPEQTAAILFTSGSTGVPKGAVYTHGIFSAQVELLRQTFGFEEGEIDLPTFPLFALFGPALGLTSIIPDMDATRPAHADPRKIIEAIENFGVTSMFGSPALLDNLGTYALEHEIRLPSLRRVLSAGAPVRTEILERVAAMLNPSVQVFTPYGATEALPVASIGSAEVLQETRATTAKGGGVCVGRPIAGMDVAVIRISDDPIPLWSDTLIVPAGAVGEITVRGPVVTRSYYHRPQATALAKISDPAGRSFYHRMGDLGYLDDKGRLWFCGRKSQRVITGSTTLFTIPCEAVFNQHPAVRRTALVGIGANGAARPVLCVELRKEAHQNDRQALQRDLLALGAAQPHTKDITSILFHPSFPVDIRHNAKIFREKLAVWAARQGI